MANQCGGEWCVAGLKKLVPRYKGCIEIQGDYVEKKEFDLSFSKINIYKNICLLFIFK